MRVAILTEQTVADFGCGDWMQASSTAAGLRALGVDVEHLLCRAGGVGSNMAVQSPSTSAPFSVVHMIPAPGSFHPSQLAGLPLSSSARFVASSVFWRSPRSFLVMLRNLEKSSWQNVLSLGKFTLQEIGTRLAKDRRFQNYDLVLPNSHAEAEVLRRYYRVKGAVVPVPNAVDSKLDLATPVPAPAEMAGEDYVLYPGVFAHRKNQLGFILAMRDLPLRIGFMGGPLPTESARRYFDRCRQEAPSHHVFWGQVPHGSDQFRSILVNARVACLASNCETPGIALLEAASAGSRPAVTWLGGTREYYGACAEYMDALCAGSIRNAINAAWSRGRLDQNERDRFRSFTWRRTAEVTYAAYQTLWQAG